MASKDNKLKARLPRGLADRTAADIRATERMVATIRTVYERYGFEPVETPLIEYTDALGKFLPDEDRPNEGVFSFQDDDEQWLSLRYDLTAPLARYVAENFQDLPRPYRSYRAGWVFRNEKPGPGRFRQFMQFDADTVGASSPAADAEMCMMAADALEALGIPRGQYVIKVNSRKVLDGLLEAIGVDENLAVRIGILRSIDKLDRVGPQGVFNLLTKGRKDESGDFTPGVGLSKPQADNLLRFVGFSFNVERGYVPDTLGRPSAPDNSAWIGWIENRVELGATGHEGLSELANITSLTRSAGYDETKVRIDLGVVRGLEYYTGAVFEAELLFEIPNEKGQPVVFGSVGGGGRYDGLIGRFRGEDTPATGFSIGVSRLQAALAALGKLDGADEAGPVVVLVMDREPARIGDYQKMVASLRAAGVAAEMYLGDSGMKAQMKYADRRKAPLAVIQGSLEKERGVVQIKDLDLGKKLSERLADNAAWRSERPGQFEVPEADLVAAVTRMVAERDD
jgi:histidyl-tRNA synthetase